ncbi:hypothetical protein [Streptomyces subrutilus]|uniref:hypothetical protein n=1 Tax=Streptomyces subrutilus TaxID=36818 RepID=UPI0033C313BD
MIRLPSSHAAITAPLPASNAGFPGIPIGRSVIDRRAYNLSPALVAERVLPSTNSIGLGGLGSGKSTTGKARILREIRMHDHQAVVIDSFGENEGGEWGPLTKALGGQIIRPGEFSLNPCSSLLPAGVPEELIRSLIVAVEPHALTPHAAYAIQQAVKHPKAMTLNGVVDALVHPEDGHRWPAAQLEVWGVEAVFALSRYTEGSLTGLFDGEGATLPPTDLPVVTFDFSSLDRNSAAIPSLMAAVSVWVEHVWLPQSTAVHRHLVLEEAWQILRDPATTALIQRLLKNSRKTGLSIHALMHTLSDLGAGKAQDLARLCEIAHVGRLAPEEAAIVGALLGLPDWAIAAIPTLDPGEAVWKVGPHSIDIVKTVLSEEEAPLMDTSTRRRAARQGLPYDSTPASAEDETETDGSAEEETETGSPAEVGVEAVEEETENSSRYSPDDYMLAPPTPKERYGHDAGDWDWDMPSTVVDSRHYDVVQAAREGRYAEAAELAVIGERHDIRSHGLHSDQALSWLSTRAAVADLGGNTTTATQLRATVTRMGNSVEWWDKQPEPEQYGPPPPGPGPEPTPAPAGPDHEEPARHRRRAWPYVAAVAALGLTTAAVWQQADTDAQEQKAAAYQGKSGASVMVDGVDADVVARWTQGRDRVIVELRSYMDTDARYLRIQSAGKSAASSRGTDRYPRSPEIELPVHDPLADVTVRIEIGGRSWTEGGAGAVRTIRLSPTGVAYDAETGDQLPRN